MGSPLRRPGIGLPLFLALWAAGICAARAGLDVPPAPAQAPDLSAYQTRSEAAAASGALQAQMPPPCAAVPSADTLMGSPGSIPCYTPRDAARPTAVQAANVVTAADGSWSVTFARPFAGASPVVNPLPVNAGALPILCNVSARSASGASGKCWQSTTTTLPGAITAVVGLLISPFSQPAGGAAVMVIAREPTQ